MIIKKKEPWLTKTLKSYLLVVLPGIASKFRKQHPQSQVQREIARDGNNVRFSMFQLRYRLIKIE